MHRSLPLLLLSGLVIAIGAHAVSGPPAAAGGLLATTLEDFRQPGTQAGDAIDPLMSGQACAGCHGHFNERTEPYRRWQASMMAQASRDPIFHAALAIAEQDADFAGDFCWRCHSPNGWVAGRALPTDGSALDEVQGDFDGVSCQMCHRMVDPVFSAENPPEDQGILAGLAHPPVHEVGGGQYVIDPEDRRRGPFDLPNFFLHEWRQSQFHRDALLCATCHDVSNPVFELQPDGTYALGNLNQAHPTADKHDQFPIERTYSEWKASDYALAPVETDGRFGGLKPQVSSCQDCHMPDTKGTACIPGLGEIRNDLPQHDLNGANSWVLAAVRRLYPDGETGLTDQLVNHAIARNKSMLRRAADLETFLRDGELVVRVINQTGHKLPTGYGEGRRMWINVRFLDGQGDLIAERGAYDGGSATLTSDTRVYQVKHGIGANVAAATGLPTGPSFHFVLNNVIEADNRIPPRGFAASVFEDLGAPVVGHSYPDEHFWDDATFEVPAGSATAVVSLLHQTTTREYIEFLRNENTTNGAGQVAYDLWAGLGKSEPVPMGVRELDLKAAPCPNPIAYGLAVRASGGEVPVLTWTGEPSPGGGFTLQVRGGKPGALATAYAGDLAVRQPLANGGFVLVGGTVTQPGTTYLDAQGDGSIPISVAAGSGGVARYYQVRFQDLPVPGGEGATPALFVELCE